jgi:hypothetical protein
MENLWRGGLGWEGMVQLPSSSTEAEQRDHQTAQSLTLAWLQFSHLLKQTTGNRAINPTYTSLGRLGEAKHMDLSTTHLCISTTHLCMPTFLLLPSCFSHFPQCTAVVKLDNHLV